MVVDTVRPVLRRTSARVDLGSDFRRLWTAHVVSGVSSQLAAGALPLIAVTVLDASALQVALLAVVGGLVSALLALPLGPWVEFRRKRPTMIGADLLRAAVLLTVPLALALDRLTFAHLLLVAVCSTLGHLVFLSASSAHLKALVGAEQRTAATGRMEAAAWTATAVGPPLGGALIGVLGVGVTMLLDGLSYLLSALGIRSIRSPEPAPPTRAVDHHWWAGLRAGWAHLFGHAGLRAFFLNSLVFGAMVMAGSPLLAVLMLRDLGLTPWQYGLALGLPALAAAVGARMAPGLVQRYGQSRVLLVSGVLRAVWLVGLALAPVGVAGLVLIVVVEGALLGAAGVFNPVFGAYRMDQTPDHVMARVGSAWSVSNRVAQAVGILAGGVLAAVTSTRISLAVCGAVLVLSIPLLPWRLWTPLRSHV